MAEGIDTKERPERLLVVAVSLGNEQETEDSIDELEQLCETAGAEICGRMIQNRREVHPGFYFGTGKIDEIRTLVEELDADGIVSDDELTPTQMRNLSKELPCKVMDRTMVILDIFAKHASTNEGKIQVELAQLHYRSSRLIGHGVGMSRLGGGIGTRGPGEKKLEVDRRIIRQRISILGKELEEVVRHRDVTRSQRQKKNIPVVAIVGYTNAGKSTLLNTLTDAGVLEENKLFATLDPTTRNLKLDNGQEILLTDTVGFIRKLPHHLVDAFRSTLEEAKYATIILHVVDSSNPQREKQMDTVYETLGQLGVTDQPIITAFNKQDLLSNETNLMDIRAKKSINIAAKDGFGLTDLLGAIEDELRNSKELFEEIIPYSEAGRISEIRRIGELIEEDYRDDGIYVKAYMPKDKH